ncbi:hypothetical protein D3C87_1956810 [compost metagenome]
MGEVDQNAACFEKCGFAAGVRAGKNANGLVAGQCKIVGDSIRKQWMPGSFGAHAIWMLLKFGKCKLVPTCSFNDRLTGVQPVERIKHLPELIPVTYPEIIVEVKD